MCEEPEEPYCGAFVVLAPDPLGYRVTLDPLPPGGDLTRTYREKCDAWRYASDLWTAGRLPLRDETQGNVARHPSKSSDASN